MNRRTFLLSWGLIAGAPFVLSVRVAGTEPGLTEPQPFSLDLLRRRAQALAADDYLPPPEQLPASLTDLDYDQYRDLRFRPSEALWADEQMPFTVQFFHLGFYYRVPVKVFDVVAGEAREVYYRPGLFNVGKNTFDPPLPEGLGFAGFRLHFPLNTPGYFDELITFLGGTYFRALGQGMHYGLSARGLAIGTASEEGEEFPVFREFYIERPTDSSSIVVHALLDSPSTTGVYSFTIRPGETTVTDVLLMLYPRRPIERVGFAPLTSMFLFGANDRVGVDDFRPEVHDSDGLSIWNGRGEWLWRPVVNPQRLRLSVFLDHNPRGFGLLQRNRDFSHYQDLEAHYEARPSVWVEPVGNWGDGAVKLIEIPSEAEINDNIVAFWEPDTPLEPGSEQLLTYRLHWCHVPPVQPEMGQVLATRVGQGNDTDTGQKIVRKFVIDYVGGKLASLKAGPVEAAVTTSHGTLHNIVSQFNEMTGGWRTFFELEPEGDDPIELRCFLHLGEEALTETWSYQWTQELD